jgi:hypothetical protein
MKSKTLKGLTYDEQKLRCLEFVKNFEDYDMPSADMIFGRKKYLIELVIIQLNSSNKSLTKRKTPLKFFSRTWRCFSENNRKQIWSKDSSLILLAILPSLLKSQTNSCQTGTSLQTQMT